MTETSEVLRQIREASRRAERAIEEALRLQRQVVAFSALLAGKSPPEATPSLIRFKTDPRVPAHEVFIECRDCGYLRDPERFRECPSCAKTLALWQCPKCLRAFASRTPDAHACP